jgi:hypothetical protein
VIEKGRKGEREALKRGREREREEKYRMKGGERWRN